MRKFEKITVTITIAEARMIATAMKDYYEKTKTHRAIEFSVFLNGEADDLESENEEMERFERATNKQNQA